MSKGCIARDLADKSIGVVFQITLSPFYVLLVCYWRGNYSKFVKFMGNKFQCAFIH